MLFRVLPNVLVLFSLAVQCRGEDFTEKSGQQTLPQNARVLLRDSTNEGGVANESKQLAPEVVSFSGGSPLELEDDGGSGGEELDSLDPLTLMGFRVMKVFTALNNKSGSSNFITDEEEHWLSEMANRKLKQLHGMVQNMSADCVKDLNYVITSLGLYKTWAWKMVDAVSKPQSSFMLGNLMYVGAYDECLGVTAEGPVQRFSGQYCLLNAGLAAKKENATDFSKILNAFLPNNEITGEQIEELQRMAFTKYGVCVPSSCSEDDVITLSKGVIVLADLEDKFDTNFVNCTTGDESQPFTGWDWFAIVVIFILILVVVLSTCHDLLNSGSTSSSLSSFSVCYNLRRLLSPAAENAPGTLHCIYGIRFISILWIVSGHRHLIDLRIPVQDFLDIDRKLEGIKAIHLTGAPLAVDTFFALSGLLLSYTFLNGIRHSRLGFNVPVFYLLRFLRLSPTYYFMLLLHATLFTHVSGGPFFLNHNPNFTGNCHRPWQNLLYINNYFDTKDTCFGPSWYLAADMQLYLISPIFLFAAWKRPRSSRYLFTALTAIGVLISFSVNYHYRIPVSLKMSSVMKAQDKFGKDHLPTHMRYTPWLVGFMAGCYLHNVQGRKFRLSKVNLVIGWSLAIGCSVFATLGRLPFQKLGVVYDPIMDPLYTALSRPLWAIALCWLIFACVVGRAGPLNTFLSWRVFQPLSRLSFGIFLIHFSLQQFQEKSGRTPFLYTSQEEFVRVSGDIMMSVLLAVPLVLVCESPFMNLTNILLREEYGITWKRDTTNGASFNKTKYCENCNHTM